MITFIYGVIEEYGLNHKRLNEIYSHNEEIVSSLPISNSWPPLSREMFSITQNDKEIEGPSLEYCGRMIHFAACLKSVEYEWDEWKGKFENLLRRLYWTQSHVHFKTEYMDVVSFEWTVDLNKWSVKDGIIKPISDVVWSFKDSDNWEEKFANKDKKA